MGRLLRNQAGFDKSKEPHNKLPCESGSYDPVSPAAIGVSLLLNSDQHRHKSKVHDDENKAQQQMNHDSSRLR